MTELINNIQAEILEHLGRFGFLAVSQLQRLTGMSAGYIREMTGSLKRRGYISSYRIEVSYRVRAENINFLTIQGKEFLLSHKNVFADDIKLPIAKNPVVTKDFWHRFHFVSLHGELWLYCRSHGIELRSFATYFDKVGNAKDKTLTAKTKIPLTKGRFYIPDGVMITGSRLYLLELYADKDTKRIINQLGLHAQAITLATPAQTFGIQDDPLVLAVFVHAGIKKAVINRLNQNEGFAPLRHLYFFATIEEVQKDIATAFTTIDNKTLSIT